MASYIKHARDGKRDNRYTFAREYCGQPTKRWVARFCGEWIGQAETREDAVKLAENAADLRNAWIAANEQPFWQYTDAQGHDVTNGPREGDASKRTWWINPTTSERTEILRDGYWSAQ